MSLTTRGGNSGKVLMFEVPPLSQSPKVLYKISDKLNPVSKMSPCFSPHGPFINRLTVKNSFFLGRTDKKVKKYHGCRRLYWIYESMLFICNCASYIPRTWSGGGHFLLYQLSCRATAFSTQDSDCTLGCSDFDFFHILRYNHPSLTP